MTKEERKDAERLADNFTPRNSDSIDANYLRQTILKVYEVACEAKRSAINVLFKRLETSIAEQNQSMRIFDELNLYIEAERAKAAKLAKLVETIKMLAEHDSKCPGQMDCWCINATGIARKAMAEYEASRE